LREILAFVKEKDDQLLSVLLTETLEMVTGFFKETVKDEFLSRKLMIDQPPNH
jgi:hypothetical protein